MERRSAKTKKHNDTSPATTDSSHNSLPGEYSLQSIAGPSHDSGHDDEYEHPPLWVAPAWQEWHEYPSNSSAGLRAIGQALLAENDPENVPLIQISRPRTANTHGAEAAETLLDLHSTPARGDESDRSPTPEPLDAALLAHARLAIQEEQDRGRGGAGGASRSAAPVNRDSWMTGIPDLIKNYSSFSSVSSRPDFQRHDSKTKSQFLTRPGRSLSTTILDDPFVLDNGESSTPHAKPTSQTTNRAHAHTNLTGSPVVSRRDSGSKRKVPPASPIHHMRAPLNPITSNRHPSANGLFANSPKKGASGNFQTPLRPSRTAGTGAPTTGGMGWMQFSSPADPAASLGLAPTHAVPTTPGLSMIIGQDTPAGGKRNRATPRTGRTPRIR
jgi:hypothetical protein